jgi:hypothetical protein
MMDRLTIALAGEPADLSGILFDLAARMEMPPGFSSSKDQSSFVYAPMQIRRVSIDEFPAGRPAPVLRSPDGGRTRVMTKDDQGHAEVREPRDRTCRARSRRALQ